MHWLNYHHLLYFWTIVREGSLTRAAQTLRLGPSTLSAQLRLLEEALGQPLFERNGRRLELTEAGSLAYDHAETIFSTGRDLLAAFRGGAASRSGSRPLRVGALAPLSKNLQFAVVGPAVMAGEHPVEVHQGGLAALLADLREHRLDLVLSNLPPGGPDARGLQPELLAEMPVFLVGRPPFRIPKAPFPEWLRDVPLVLPSTLTPARLAFDALLVRHGIAARVRAEVDDMALLRLLASSGAGLALVPEIVVRDELADRSLLRVEVVPDITERFYAITAERRFPHPAVAGIVAAARRALASRPGRSAGIARRSRRSQTGSTPTPS